MADEMHASIDEARIDGQSFAYKLTTGGPAGVAAYLTTTVYDGLGTQAWSEENHDLAVGAHSAQVDLAALGLADGDYGAWVYVGAYLPDDMESAGAQAQQGVSFLVGRGQVYASTEAAAVRDAAPKIAPTNMRLEGNWIAFDMHNPAAYDVAVAHRLYIFGPGGTEQKIEGEELIQAGGTGIAHHLLPDDLIDQQYTLLGQVQPAGSDDFESTNQDFRIELRDGVVAHVP